jgi:hypothetical protein
MLADHFDHPSKPGTEVNGERGALFGRCRQILDGPHDLT